MEFVKIVLVSIALSIVYGIAHDLVTAHVCVEYFTIGHPRLFATNAPVAHALAWGVIATWWAGAIVGVLAGVCATVGQGKRWTWRRVARAQLVLLAIMAVAALGAGLAGYAAAESGALHLGGGLQTAVPPEKHSRFIADGAAHLASYVVGFVGGLVLCVIILVQRSRDSKIA